MCGLAGLLSQSAAAHAALPEILERISHRGPDDRGLWSDPEIGLALGHLRLSIIDVSPAGHQPMVSASGRYVLAFNGEIYNFAELRSRLDQEEASPAWRGHSDTEVLLAAIEAWGVQRTLERAEGMLAFVLWDRETHCLTLARDRMGEKPLYFGWIGNDFVFASELKALSAHPDWAPQVNPDALSEFLRLGYHGGACSMLRGLYRMPPGCILTLGTDALSRPMGWDEIVISMQPYWQLTQVAKASLTPWTGTLVEAANELERLLSEAVAEQMVADVPIGAFLSGGFDSSLVVSLMQRHCATRVRTFCVGFDDPAHDEAGYAQAVARHLNTEHHEHYVDDRQALELVPDLPDLFDEPLADPSQIPTLLVARLARKQVKVALTGDGGDELFAGYLRYPAILRYWEMRARMPRFARSGLTALFEQLAATDTEKRLPKSDVGMRLARFAARHRGHSLEGLRRAQIGGPDWGILRAPTTPLRDISPLLTSLRQLLLADQMDYLPNDILMKVDRAAMSTSLETRVPMLDPTIVDFSWRLRDDDLLKAGQGKRVLRDIAFRHVPRHLLERPKKGFAPPIGLWLRGALRDWAQSLFDELPASLDSVVDTDRLLAVWHAHQAAHIDAGYALWRVLMYLSWARRFRVVG